MGSRMRIGVFGGAFNPPHNGHVKVAESTIQSLKLDKMLIVPTGTSPHKVLPEGSPDSATRFRMAKLAFSAISKVTVLDIEINRSGLSYTSDTLKVIHSKHPNSHLFLIVGADMYLTIQSWHRAEDIFKLCTICALCRESGQLTELLEHRKFLADKFGAKSIILQNEAVEISSTYVRDTIRRGRETDLVPPQVLSYIRDNSLYGEEQILPAAAGPVTDIESFRNAIGEELYERAFTYVRHSRRGHIEGCIGEAIGLANRWDEDPKRAATAALFHDITKSFDLEEQLNLCKKYGIIPRTIDKVSFSTLHAITGAVMTRELLGADSEIESAIRYHTTGRPDMTKLEIILYLADYIEPTRDFRGVSEVRYFAYRDLDFAMLIALKNTIETVSRSCRPLSPDTVEAYNFYLTRCLRKPL